MNYSARDPATGAWADVICRKNPHEAWAGWYFVWLGETMVGQVAFLNGWTAVSGMHPLSGHRMVKGFGTRRHAIDYLLQVGGIHPYGAGYETDEMILAWMDIRHLGPDDLALVKHVNKILWGKENVETELLFKTLDAIDALRRFENQGATP